MWLTSLLPTRPWGSERHGPGRGPRRAAPQRRATRPRLEALEARALLSVVANTDDSGFGSLRAAIIDSNSHPSSDPNNPNVITFIVHDTIALASALPDLHGYVTIQGPGASVLTVQRPSASPAFRIFTVSADAHAMISGLTISGGRDNVGDGIIGGGGIYNGGTLTVSASTLASNTAYVGGGIYNDWGTLTVSASTLASNSSYGSGGGGIANNGGRLTVSASTLVSNSAGNFGGGVFLNNGGTVTAIISSTLAGNSAVFGGGIEDNSGGTLTVSASTLAGNSAHEGGGIEFINWGTLTVSSSILGGNSASSAPDVFANVGLVNSRGYNLVGVTDGSSGWTMTDLTGTSAAPLDPKLGPLQDNGGPTQTMALLPGSPAIDAGDSSLIPAGVNTDQRGPGFPRIIGGTVDIGAFEYTGISASNLAQVLQQMQAANPGQPITINLGTPSDADAHSLADAINALGAQSPPVTFQLGLVSGYYYDLHLMPAEGVTVVVSGTRGQAIISGGSPALTVSAGSAGSGSVIITDLRLTTATDDPTVLVTGGSLTLRNDVIEESTGYAQAAVSLSGGTLDLGTAANPGNNILDINGLGEFIHNTTGNAVPAVGDNFEVNGSLLRAAPTVGAINAPVAPIGLSAATINASASFTDPDSGDTHTATWNWGDGTNSTGTVTESGGTGTVSGTHTYTTVGVYTITLTVTDLAGMSGQSAYEFVVVYDPSGGFVTGGGWINSPAGAYAADPALAGKANFGFVSKYQKGATVPTGETEFQFQVANFNFHSTSYDWLVVAGARAQYKGSGTINGAGTYRFLLTAIDGQAKGGGGIDKFRIKIWDKTTGAIIYDNQMAAADSADPTTALGGGSIVLHT